ncbi:hypothetical protein BDF14DRAFT_1827860 [Spinellus fusiger]|nr:hypothetical protein BDF14DRAFT_1827860 [Spinellus fusiger]
MLLARAPNAFREKYFSIPKDHLQGTECRIKLPDTIPLTLFQALVRFWYTSDFCPSSVWEETDTPSSSTPSTPATSTSSMIDISIITPHLTIEKELEELKNTLGVDLLPIRQQGQTDFEILVQDLTRMFEEQLASDVILDLHPAPLHTLQSSGKRKGILCEPTSAPPAVFPVHRFLLAAQSSYFYAMFCTDFKEALDSTVYLTDELLTPWTLHVLLRYFYTNTIIIPSLPIIAQINSVPLQRLSHKKHSLRVLQKTFHTADYLSHTGSAGLAVLNAMSQLCHEFRCTCTDCSTLLPSMLLFAYKNRTALPTMVEGLLSLYTDPVQSIAPLWSTKSFAILIHSMAHTAIDLSDPSTTLSQITKTAQPSTLIKVLIEQTQANITKHNAIHALHSLHLCLSFIRGHDPSSTWSAPVYDLLQPFVRHTVAMISRHFDFYCVEYPILLSCVDGIGFGFSVDFLEFLLKRVLDEGIQNSNAGSVYQGIVRDLVGRQEVVHNAAVDDVLIEARQQCAAYLARRWTAIKAQGGFSILDKETLQKLSGGKYSLFVFFFFLFFLLFSFKPKAAKAALKSKFSEVDSSSTLFKSNSHSSRRLSLGTLRTRRSSSALQTKATQDAAKVQTRPRSRSNESPVLRRLGSSGYLDRTAVDAMSSQPLIHLLSLETEARLQHAHPAYSTPTYTHHHSNPSRRRDSVISLTEALLPLEISAKVPSLPVVGTAKSVPRATRLQSPTKSNKKPASSRRWRRSSDASEEEDLRVTPVIGAKVELLRRPLPTLGKIKFIGSVEFSKGTWVGVELESRLGNSDGSVEGVRYFQTDAQRGVFVKPDDYKIITMPSS